MPVPDRTCVRSRAIHPASARGRDRSVPWSPLHFTYGKNKRTRPPVGGRVAWPNGLALLQQANLAIEAFGARVQRYANAAQCSFGCDGLTLRVADIQQFARIVVPKRLGDLIDQILVLIGRRVPLRADSHGRGCVNPFVGSSGNVALREKTVGFGQRVRALTGN